MRAVNSLLASVTRVRVHENLRTQLSPVWSTDASKYDYSRDRRSDLSALNRMTAAVYVTQPARDAGRQSTAHAPSRAFPATLRSGRSGTQ
jgi:hypothetical protein